MQGLRLETERVVWGIDPPFVISSKAYTSIEALIVCLISPSGAVGRGEAIGVDYLGESVDTMRALLDSHRDWIETDLSHDRLLEWLPPGGARNGLDLALWDLQAQVSQQPVHALADLPQPRPVRTAFTISVMSPEQAALKAKAAADFSLLKLKASKSENVELVAAVRQARPDATLIVDANESWDFQDLLEFAPALQSAGVDVLEQPLKSNQDDALLTYDSPVPLMADESCQALADLDKVRAKYRAINIKLDKTGGLTEAVRLARTAREHGLKIMVGNMCGSSLAMAPAFLLAQICDYADLDGPLLQTSDWPSPLVYEGGLVQPSVPPSLWGGI